MLVLHHIAIDGWSLEIVVSDLAALYNAYRHGVACALPELPVQYADYAAWQRQWLDGEVRDTQIEYWKQRWDRSPTDRPLPPVQTFNGATEPFELPESLSDALRSLSRHENATLFMTLLAAWQTLLARYTGRDAIAVGTPVANRGRTEIEQLIGFFVNTLVLRTSLDGDPSFRDLLARVRTACVDAYAHQDLPFEKLVEELQRARLRAVAALPGHVRAQDTSTSADVMDLDTSYCRCTTTPRSFNERQPGDSGAASRPARIQHDADRATIQRIVSHYLTLLEAVAADPNQRLSELPLLSQVEHAQIAGWNDTARSFGDARSIVDLFEEQAARAPDAVAVIADNQRITFAALNARANQLARYLRTLGVGAETRVGIALERSADMVVALRR